MVKLQKIGYIMKTNFMDNNERLSTIIIAKYKDIGKIK
jgi:hypothetical protein